MSRGRCLGRVVAIARYPVKSMAGEALDAAELLWTGLAGDRRHAFVRDGDRSRFPWLTGRVLPELVLHRPALRDAARPAGSEVSVTLPDGACLPVDDPALARRLSERAGEPVRPIQLGRGTFDAMPVSLVTTASLAAIDAAHGTPLDPRRFRLNLVIESDAAELDWPQGRVACDGGAELCLADPIPRCAMITLDPDTAARDPGVLRTVAQRFANAAGRYAATARPGWVRVGDAVRVVA